MYDPAKAPAILVTGASTGIGESCAHALVKLGYRVYAGVRRSLDAHRLARHHAMLTPIMLDVTNPLHISDAVALIRREVGEGGLYAIVNNAGIAVAAPLEYLPIGEFRRQMEINVTGLLAVTQAFLPLLRESHGRIVHIGSNSGRLSTPFSGAYAASKFAVEALTDAMRRELRGSGVQVSLIQPGAIATPIWEKSTDHAERLHQALPAEAHAHYGIQLAALRKVIASRVKSASAPELVSRAVVHAITAKNPKTRYAVGDGARTQIFLGRFLPDRWVDYIVLKMMGIW